MTDTTHVEGLGYLGIRTRDLDAWRDFGVNALDMVEAPTSTASTVRLKMDENVYRIEVAQADDEAVAHTGWEVRDLPTLEALAARLDDAGIAIELLDDAAASQREVAHAIRVQDPDGMTVELYVGARKEDTRPFRSTHGTAFVAGPLGLGHLVMFCEDHDASMHFYTRLLGLGVTDFLVGHFRGAFLGSTARHHSLALFAVDGVPHHIDHFMVEVDTVTDLGQAHDRCLLGAAPITHTMGQHWNDHATSFYVRTPSGFGVEYGWGARRVERDGWISSVGDGEISFWGHHATSQEDARMLRADHWLADYRLTTNKEDR